MDPRRTWVRRRSAMKGNATWSEHLGVAEVVGKNNWSCSRGRPGLMFMDSLRLVRFRSTPGLDVRIFAGTTFETKTGLGSSVGEIAGGLGIQIPSKFAEKRHNDSSNKPGNHLRETDEKKDGFAEASSAWTQIVAMSVSTGRRCHFWPSCRYVRRSRTRRQGPDRSRERGRPSPSSASTAAQCAS